MREMLKNVRKNYLRIYLKYVYLNVERILYLKVENIFKIIIMIK